MRSARIIRERFPIIATYTAPRSPKPKISPLIFHDTSHYIIRKPLSARIIRERFPIIATYTAPRSPKPKISETVNAGALGNAAERQALFGVVVLHLGVAAGFALDKGRDGFQTRLYGIGFNNFFCRDAMHGVSTYG